MADSIFSPAGDKGPQPNPRSEQVGVRLEPDLLSALDRYAKEHGDMTRGQALRVAFRDWAIAHGYVPSADDGTRPEDLNASNDD
jgi:hypothetical protein